MSARGSFIYGMDDAVLRRQHPTFTNDMMFGGGAGAYTIDYGLRLRAANSAYLTRTPGSTSNRILWSYSVRMKRGALGSIQSIFSAYSAFNDTGWWEAAFDASDGIYISGWSTTWRLTTAVYRDPSAWYDILIVWDTANGTAQNRIRLYVNGTEVTTWTTNVDPGASANGAVNLNTAAHYIGRQPNTGARYFDGLMAEARLIDGQALTPSSFGETSATTGQWVPKRYTGTYGTNGFFLDFSNASSTTTIGYDAAGSNDWTTSGISVTAGSTFDQMTDTPSANYGVINPLNNSGTGITNANRSWGHGAAAYYGATITQPITFKTYIEIKLDQTIGAGTNIYPGVKASGTSTVAGSYLGQGSASEYSFGVSNSIAYATSNNVQTSHGAAASGAILQYAIDPVGGNIWFGVNNSWIDSGNPSTGANPKYTGLAAELWFYVQAYATGASCATINTGQAPFAYTPPTGFNALNTANLPTPAIPNGASYFNAVLRTGTGASASVSSLAFQPDLVWIKGRSGATDHGLYDAVRGVQKQIESNTSDAETTETTGLTAFSSTGYTVGALAQLNTNAATYVDWSWKEGVTPGFDIVTYTGNATNRTIAHSLGAVPHLMMVKNLTSATGWTVYHRNMNASPQNGNLTLNSTAAYGAAATSWNSTAPTSSVFSVGTANAVNGNTNSLVNYLWTEIPGFSAFGSYTGNGSADGPFVWCGFKPRFVMIKNATAVGGWWMIDTVRQTYNQITNLALTADSSAAEGGAGYAIDILSGGFKPRGSGSDYNTSGQTYIYAAFAEAAYKFSTAR